MNALPPGWAWTTLGDVADVVSGSTPRTAVSEYWGGDIAWITPDDLSGYSSKYIESGARSITQAGYDSCSTTLMPPGSVLFSSRAPIGYVAIARGSVCTNQGFKSFVPSEAVTSDYLYWFLRSSTPAIRATGSGTTFAEVSKKRIQPFPLPLPPLHEQRRIVAAIEEQISRLDTALDALERARRRLRVLRSGALARLLDAPWPRARISDVALVGSGATPKRGRDDYWVAGTVPWVTSGQLVTPFVREPAALITEKALRETNVKLWPKHTLLVALYGEGKTRGHCSELLIESTTNQACASIVVKDESVVDRAYLKLFFAASYEANRRLASGGVQPNLSLGLIKGLQFPLPPLAEQHQIIRETDRQLSVIEAITAALETASRRAGALRRSVLARAFRGELVRQDSEDEPASLLLERVAAERAAAPKASRKRHERTSA